MPFGFWDLRGIVSREGAVKKLGTSCINEDDQHQHIHIGG